MQFISLGRSVLLRFSFQEDNLRGKWLDLEFDRLPDINIFVLEVIFHLPSFSPHVSGVFSFRIAGKKCFQLNQ